MTTGQRANSVIATTTGGQAMRIGIRTILAGLMIASIQAVFVPSSVRAQGASLGVSSGWPYGGGGTSYVPYGGGFGGFVPYRSTPGVGIGPTSQMAELSSRPTMADMGMSGGTGTALGAPRSMIAPLGPLRLMGAGMGGRMSRRGDGPAGAMGGMPRPPVGYYPFRVPPSLSNPASGPQMSM
jgi:hypothetical protein